MVNKKSRKKPKVLNEFVKLFPKTWTAYKDLRNACDTEGKLDTKTRELIKIGIETSIGGHA